MPSVSFDGQSFSWNGRRLWLVGANLEYALMAPERWSTAIGSLRQMGFNTIRASVPWCLHECRRGRFDFAGGLDVGAFLRECRAQGMHVLLRLGPVVGEPFDGGGLPAWLAAEPGVRLRQVNETFLKHVNAFLRAVAEQVRPLQASEAQNGGGFGDQKPGDGGPLLAVQIEHAWNCGNETAGHAYHAELLRVVRERGFTVPVLTCNGLWIHAEGCVEVWEGWNDLFPHLRQLQQVQPDAPRLVEIREEAAKAAGVGDKSTTRGGWSVGMDLLGRMGQILAAGGQPILPGVQRSDRSNAVPALLDGVGRPNAQIRSVRRMVSFANHFGHVYADADGSRQVAVQAPDGLQPGGFSVISVEGSAGRVNFVFRGPDAANGERHDAAELVTTEGGRMRVELGDAPVGWYLFDVSLHGRATLDWCNQSPWALIDRSLLVLQGPAGSAASLSIDGGELQFTLPEEKAGAKPVVLQHQGMVVVGCNQSQIDAAVIYGRSLLVGVERVHADGDIDLAHGFKQAFRVESSGRVQVIPPPRGRAKPVAASLKGWQMADCGEFMQGTSQRFAGISGPAGLGACGAYLGWGWYRVQWKQPKGGLLLPGAAGLMHAWMDGKPIESLLHAKVPMPLATGQHTLTVLARQGGRTASQAVAGVAIGLPQAPHVVQPLAAKVSVIDAPTEDPFKIEAFIPGLAPGQLPSPKAVKIGFQQRRKEPILIDADGLPLRALVLVNGRAHGLVDWHGQAGDVLVLRMATKAEPKRGLQSGSNEVVLVPLQQDGAGAEKLAKAVRCFASMQELHGDDARWAFARWEAPQRGLGAWRDLAAVKPGTPRWFMACFERPKAADGPVAIECVGLSHGHVFVNDQLVGGYDLAAGREQVEIPTERLQDANTLVIFDAQGRSPAGVRVRG